MDIIKEIERRKKVLEESNNEGSVLYKEYKDLLELAKTPKLFTNEQIENMNSEIEGAVNKELGKQVENNKEKLFVEKIKESVKNPDKFDEEDMIIFGQFFPELVENEDEKIRKALIEFIYDKESNELYGEYGLEKQKVLNWLEKIGEQKNLDIIDISEKQKQRWGEEDEKKVNNLYVLLDQMVSFNMLSNKDATEFKDWLKFIKERYTWKPSDGQLECLGNAIEKAKKDWSPLTNNRIYLTLKALNEQLKKLKKE